MYALVRTLTVAVIVSSSVNTRVAALEPVRVDESSPAGRRGQVRLSEDELDPATYMQARLLQDLRMAANRTRRAGDRRVFVIPAAPIPMEDHLAVERDMHIMSHIFDQVLKKPQMIGGVFKVMDDFFGRDSRVTEVIYLDGYGLLFFMEVNLALTEPSESEEEEPQEAEDHVDATWRRAELELYAPQHLRRNGEDSSGQVYDAEKVKVLKSNLVESLKHATNIQALRPDDAVILTVVGTAYPSAASLGQLPVTVRRGGRDEWYFSDGHWSRRPGPDGAGTSKLSLAVLTIRAKKSDIDAFSKGELDLDQFSRRTQVFTY